MAEKSVQKQKNKILENTRNMTSRDAELIKINQGRSVGDEVLSVKGEAVAGSVIISIGKYSMNFLSRDRNTLYIIDNFVEDTYTEISLIGGFGKALKKYL